MTRQHQLSRAAAAGQAVSTGTLPSALPGVQTPASAVDKITDRLITAIAIGEYLPESRLPAERELAASLQVGRMTVRSAIARLVQGGLLETRRGRGGGSFVREPSGPTSNASVHRTLTARWDALRDTCEAVSLLHGTIARAAAKNRTDVDVQVLRERLECFRNAGSGQPSQKADELLHLSIAEAAHNATLRGTLFELESRVSIAAPAYLWGSPIGMREMELRALADHENLVAAICERQVERAGTIGAEHAHIDLELLEAALREADPLEA
ncbi:FadR family transcriptional regulator [Paeniglutamicibacter antarcticus]|uniref:FadR family transcriptional regulator n=1 Tax=Arthrobacter terrae TaxID=2935737 RepID=A0A931GBS1_9MICC|nr:GntR family transcriptional regulator [Arthrobacter terrae]MBG0741027.1 FadR family transcriptional regulator [Arthrobacter terrae]